MAIFPCAWRSRTRVPRTLRFEVTPADLSHGVTVKRVVGVDPHAKTRFTLSIPAMAFRLGAGFASTSREVSWNRTRL